MGSRSSSPRTRSYTPSFTDKSNCSNRGLKFKFIAESLSDKLVWLKSVELTSDSKSTAKLVFNPQIFRNGEVTQLRQDMPADFTGEVKISSVDAMVRVDNCWKECLVIVRGVKNDETDLEFFADEES